MSKKNIWISDLTHTAQGISANTFPLGISYVAAYAKKELSNNCDIRLFKFPSHLAEVLNKKSPTMLCFSNFSWNLELSYKFASLAKKRDPNVITVFGGPNFPTEPQEKLEFLKKRSAIDFYIELEGELAFVDLTKNLIENNFNSLEFKKKGKTIINTCYVHDNHLICGPVERIIDINILPSPYFAGFLDEYFNFPLIPMIETTRGCPFSCAFCCDGHATKNRVHRYDSQRTEEELYYIAKKVKNVDSLIITDLNFAMYKQDVVTAKAIKKIQEIYKYPKLIEATAGKNMPKRTIEVGKIMKGWIAAGASIQSTDPTVLKAIKRQNISTEAYQEVIDHANSIEGQSLQSHSEILLGLPEDSKEKHFESLRFGVDNKITHIHMYQTMMLMGSDMSSKATGKKYGLKTMFRTIPGCLGIYNIFGKKRSIAEIEEIIVGSNTLSKKDYLECRVLNFFVETFYNNSLFEEVFVMLRSLKVSVFDCLVYMKEHPEFYSKRIKEILKDFIFQTTEDLYETWEQANQYVLTPDIINKYIGGELGINELQSSSATLFGEFDDVCYLMFESVRGTLKQKGALSQNIKNYLLDLQKFITMRKKNPLTKTDQVISSTFKYDFEAIREAKYSINPNSIPMLKAPLQYDFFHDQKQQEHIANQVKLYSKQANGFGKLLVKSNVRLFFRQFSKSRTVHAGL